MFGDHAMHCGWGPERIQRHNAFRDCLAIPVKLVEATQSRVILTQAILIAMLQKS